VKWMPFVLRLLAADLALVPIPFPELAGLEPAVGRHLTEVRARLEAAGRTVSAASYGSAGRVYHVYAMHAAAEACYRNAEALAPGERQWPYLLSVVLESVHRPEEARRSVERALAGTDQYYPAVLRLARLHLEEGRTAAAAAVLVSARRHAPDDPALLALLGDLSLREGRPRDAANALGRALAAQPAANRLHYPLAMALRALGDADGARAHLAQVGPVGVTARDPVLDEVWVERRSARADVAEGLRAATAGDFAPAEEAFRRAIAGDPSNVSALTNLAALEARRGDVAAAIGHLERAVEAAPTAVTARYNLGLLLVQAGRPVPAEPHLRAALDLAPKDDGVRLALASALTALGRPGEALDLVDQVRTLDGAHCGALRDLLRVLEKEPGEDAARRTRAAQARLEEPSLCLSEGLR
jgi:tetratricopeptide (TPR) repeat protein